MEKEGSASSSSDEEQLHSTKEDSGMYCNAYIFKLNDTQANIFLLVTS